MSCVRRRSEWDEFQAFAETIIQKEKEEEKEDEVGYEDRDNRAEIEQLYVPSDVL